MYYFKTFNNYNDYLSYKNGNNFLLPNLSLTKNDNQVYYTPYTNEAGDIVLHNGSRYYTCKRENLVNVWNPSLYTVEGIVVVPNTHTPDGSTRFISLAAMSLTTPDTGSLSSNTTMKFGGYGYDIPEISNKTTVRTTQNVAGDTTYGTNSYGYLPSDRFSGVQSIVDPSTRYYYDGVNNTTQTPFIESAYLSDGTPNLNYRYGTLNDFDGAGNTAKILLHATGENWEELSTLTDSQDAGYYPAAEVCVRYSTENTPNWYLPAAGELGYLPLRITDINNSIATINTVCGSGSALSIPISWFWSSSEYSAYYSYYVGTSNGYVNISNKYISNFVRAFASAVVRLGIL